MWVRDVYLFPVSCLGHLVREAPPSINVLRSPWAGRVPDSSQFLWGTEEGWGPTCRKSSSLQWFSLVNCAWYLQSRALCFLSRKHPPGCGWVGGGSHPLQWGNLGNLTALTGFQSILFYHLLSHPPLSSPLSFQRCLVLPTMNHVSILACKAGWFLF